MRYICIQSVREVPSSRLVICTCRCICSSCDMLAKLTISVLYSLDLPVVKKFHDPNKRSIRQSNGHVFLFCKIRGDADEIGLPKNNVWYFNSYDLDSAFDEYFANPTVRCISIHMLFFNMVYALFHFPTHFIHAFLLTI